MSETLEAWLSVRLVEAPGELSSRLDEDRREAGRDEQRGGHQTQQLAVSGAQHALASVPAGSPGAGRPSVVPLGFAGASVASRAPWRARRRWPHCPSLADMSGFPVTSHDDERPPSPGWGMLKRFAARGGR